MMRRALGTTAGIAVLLSALLTAGWASVALLLVVVVIVVAAVCWIVADPERPDRLALLITSWRAGTVPRSTSRTRINSAPSSRARKRPDDS
jgi:hypothetical protein